MEIKTIPGNQMPDDMREKLLAHCRRERIPFGTIVCGGIALLILVLAVRFLLSTPEDIEVTGVAAANYYKWEQFILGMVLAVIPLGVMAVLFSEPPRKLLKHVQSGDFTYYLGTLTNKLHEVYGTGEQGENSHYYALCIDSDDEIYPCSSRTYKKAVIGETYALIYCGGESPDAYVRVS